MVGLGFLLAYLAAPYPQIAMWVGFLFAAYSAVANDSIQTLGTFIASNRDAPWWLCWIFAASILAATIAYSWVNYPNPARNKISYSWLHYPDPSSDEASSGTWEFKYGGDVSHGRLASKGFKTAPTEFEFLQLAAPVFLLILTRLRIPVSTTFLLLSCFAASGSGILSVTKKSLIGYGIAFVCSILLWRTLGRFMQRKFTGKAHPAWRVFQWATTGCLWSVWLMQDAANIAVFLPRSLSWVEATVFVGVIVCGLGLLFKMGGESIQKVVDEKSNVVDVRPATMIDLLYAIILYVFKIYSNVPMSTTWVFVGLLAGRELGMALTRSSEGKGLRHAYKLMFKDLRNVTIGFVISLILAAAINPKVRESLFGIG